MERNTGFIGKELCTKQSRIQQREFRQNIQDNSFFAEKITEQQDNSNALSDESQAQSNDLMKITIVDEASNVYCQMTQILRLIESTLLNGENKNLMAIKHAEQFENIAVINVPRDGNCLFGACAHQIKRYKVNSTEHNDLVYQLRKNVADYISNNLNWFKQSIKVRIENESERMIAVQGKFVCSDEDISIFCQKLSFDQR